MQANRNIRKSIRAWTESALTDMGFTNFYDEVDMRVGTTPAGNYIFIVDTMTKPMTTALPFLALEVQDIDAEEYELGNRRGRNFNVFMHVFGDSRGTRDDIASYLQDSLKEDGGIDYNDYSTSGSTVSMGYRIELDSRVRVSDSPPPDDQIQEYSLANWTILSFSARTRQ